MVTNNQDSIQLFFYEFIGYLYNTLPNWRESHMYCWTILVAIKFSKQGGSLNHSAFPICSMPLFIPCWADWINIQAFEDDWLSRETTSGASQSNQWKARSANEEAIPTGAVPDYLINIRSKPILSIYSDRFSKLREIPRIETCLSKPLPFLSVGYKF